MPNQVDEETKQIRQKLIMETQKYISRDYLQSFIGTDQAVLVKGLSEESDLLGEGRLAIKAPEVDGVVYINEGRFVPGTIQRVRITEAHDYDLVGRILEK